MKHEYIIGSIRVVSPTSATMKGTYSIWGVAELDCDSSISVRETANLPSKVEVRANKDEDITAEIDVFNAVDTDVEMTVKQTGFLNAPGIIGVTPKNTMWGQYEIIEPLPIIQKVFSSKDTYIRSQRPRVNYGRENSLIVGNNFGDEYRTLIKYDLDVLPEDVEVRGVTLVLKGIENINQFLVDVRNVLDPWEEYSTTWVNSPRAGEVLQSFISGNTVNEVRVDITSLFFAWRDGITPNNGIYLVKKAIEDVGTRTYGSRESNIAHYVEIEYLSPNLYSFNNSYNQATIEVGYYSDLEGSIDVKPTEWETSIDTTLYVRDPKNMPAQFLVNKPNMHAQMMVKYARDFDLATTIRIPEYSDDDLLSIEAYIRAIGEGDLETLLDVEYKHLTDALLEVRPTLDIPSQLMIPYPEEYDGLGGVIEIMDGFNKPTELTVANVYEIEGSLHVASVDEVHSEIFVKHETYWDAKLRVTPVLDTPAVLGVKVEGQGQWEGQFTATIYKDIVARLKVNPYHDLPSTIGVKVDGDSEWQGQLEVDYGLTLPVAIYVRGDDIDGRLTVRSPGSEDLEVELMIRYEDFYDNLAELLPRVFGNTDTPGHLKPRVESRHHQLGFFKVRVGDSLDLDVKMEVEEIKFRGYVFIM